MPGQQERPEVTAAVTNAINQLDANHPVQAAEIINQCAINLMRDQNPAQQRLILQAMTTALVESGVLPRLAGTAFTEPVIARIDTDHSGSIQPGEAAAFAQNTNGIWGTDRPAPLQIMTMAYLATHMNDVTTALGRPAGSVTLSDLASWTRKAEETRQANTAANNVLHSLEAVPAAGATRDTYLRRIREAEQTLQRNGQLTGIEQGKPGQMSDLVAEYARTHFTALSNGSGKITLESLDNYINRTPGLTDFAKKILAEMKERFAVIAKASGDEPGSFPWSSNGSITIAGLEKYAWNAWGAREAMGVLSTQDGFRAFAGQNPDGTYRDYLHRDKVTEAKQGFERELLTERAKTNPDAATIKRLERMIRVGQWLQTQISHNTWDNHVRLDSGINSCTTYATGLGYKPGDYVNAQGAISTPEAVAAAQAQQPPPAWQLAVPGQPAAPQTDGQQQQNRRAIENIGRFGQPAPQTDGQQRRSPPLGDQHPVPQQQERPDWARPGAQTPERRLMDQIIGLLRADGPLTNNSKNELRRLLNQYPETMDRIVVFINEDLQRNHCPRQLGLAAGTNPDGSMYRTLSVMNSHGTSVSTNEATITQGTQPSEVQQPTPAPAPELTAWQRQVREKIVSAGVGFVGAEQYDAAAAAATASHRPLIIVYGNQNNPALLDAARARMLRGDAVVLYVDGLPPPNSYVGQMLTAAGSWVPPTGGAIKCDLTTRQFVPENLTPQPQQAGNSMLYNGQTYYQGADGVYRLPSNSSQSFATQQYHAAQPYGAPYQPQTTYYQPQQQTYYFNGSSQSGSCGGGGGSHPGRFVRFFR